MTNQQISELYFENMEARKQHGFTMPGSRAMEDTAIMFDISIMEVCLAVSGYAHDQRLAKEIQQ